MPTSPAQWEAVALEVRRIYADAETTLLERVARRLERGIEGEGWAEARLSQVQTMRREVERVIARVSSEGGNEIERAVFEAYEGGSEQATNDLAQVLDRPIERTLSTINRQAVEILARHTIARVQTTHLAILRTTDDIFRRVIAEASGQAVTGAMTRRQAAQAALDRFADAGITGFRDRSGRNWDIASYAEMATRSASGRAAIEGHSDRLQANGYDLVIVSDSPDECSVCRPWEGRILSLGGEHAGEYPTVDEARAAGLFHPNCTHAATAYIPGLTERQKRAELPNPEGYEIRQRQRQIERHIRRWKRRRAVALDDGARQYAGRKVRMWQAEQRKHLALAGREFKRDYGRESITRAR